MRIKLLLVLSLVALWSVVPAQTYTYNYSVLKNGTTKNFTPSQRDLKVKRDSKKCQIGNKTYQYKGRYDGFWVYEIRSDMGFTDGQYVHKAEWLIFSASFDEMSMGESQYARNIIGQESDLSEGVSGIYESYGMGSTLEMLGMSTSTRKILDVYSVNPMNDLRSRYQEVSFDRSRKIYYVRKGKYYGICDAVGDEILSPNRYTSIRGEGDGYVITENGRVGYMGNNFIPIVPTIYTKVTLDGSSGFYVEDGYLKGYCDSRGKVSFPLRSCTRLVKDYPGFKVYVGNYVGYYNSDGTEVIAPNKYTDIEKQKDGFLVKNGSLKGYCSPSGNELVSPQFYDLTRDGNNGYIVKDSNGNVGYVNQNGKTVVKPLYTSVTRSGSSGFYVRSGATQGFLDANGTPIVPVGKYTSVSRNSSGGFQVKKGSLEGYLDATGKEIISPKYNSVTKEGNRYRVQLNGLDGWCDSRGKLILPPWKYLYFEMTYGFGIDHMNHFVGAQFTNVRRMVGYNVALTGGLTSGSVTLMGGPTFRLNRRLKSLQLYGQVGGTYGFHDNGGFSLAAGGGFRYGFNKEYGSKLDWFSITLGAQYIEQEIVPTLGVCVVPVVHGFSELVGGDNYFPRHFSEMTIGYGDDLYLGANYTFLKNRLGLYTSVAFGLFDGALSFNVGPAFRLTNSRRNDLDLQLYQGIGTFDGDLGGETGLRFGFTSNRKYGTSSMSLGAIYSEDHYGVMFGMSWPLLFFPFAMFY